MSDLNINLGNTRIRRVMTSVVVLSTVFLCNMAFAQKTSLPPNVLMIVVDDLNDHVGVMGHPDAITPNIDRLASGGVLFKRAQCPAPLCGPSRAAVMTGLRPSTTGIYGMIDDDRIRSANAATRENIFLHEYFRRSGYYTMGVGKIFHHHAPDGLFHESGGASEYGPRPAERFQWKRKGTDTDWGAFPEKDEQMPDDTAVHWTIERLGRTYTQPFFLTVGLIRPHVPWYVPEKWYRLYDTAKIHLPPYLAGDRDDLPVITRRIDDWPSMPPMDWVLSNGQWKNMLRAYLACVSYTDHNIGRILLALEKSPHARNTIIILWSDHGYRMGEKDRFAKMALWEKATRAPLIIAGPGIPGNKKVEVPVEMLSLYPTLTDLCRLPPNRQNEAPSLTPLISGKSSTWIPAITTWGRNNHAVRNDSHTYIRYEDGSEEFYDHRQDPFEWNNLATSSLTETQRKSMARYLPKVNEPWAADAFYNANDYFKSKQSTSFAPTGTLVPKEYRVATVAELMAAVQTVNPGDAVLLEDGGYPDVKLIIERSGTAGQPIRIGARNSGRVFFTGDVKVELRGEHLILEGIRFERGARKFDEWKSHGPGLVAIYGSYNRVTQCGFDAFDDANSAWVTTSIPENGKVPQHCRIDHCSFTNKLTFDQVINLNNTRKATFDSLLGGPPMYHRVDHNFFSNPPKPGNAGGGIRVGYFRFDTGRCVIDSNLFMRQDSEPEIVTSKSRENVYYANTIINCQGTLNFRHGDRQFAINNFFLATDSTFGYGGMFVWGSNHLIACNYFNLPRTLKTRGNAALYLNPGTRGTEHALAFDIRLIRNVFEQTGGYAIHFNPLDKQRIELSTKNGWRFETPFGIRFVQNLFIGKETGGFPLFKSDYEHIGRYVWLDNIAYGAPSGIGEVKGLQYSQCRPVRKDGQYQFQTCPLLSGSNIQHLASVPGIQMDMNRFVNQGIAGRPLTIREVGPSWFSIVPEYTETGILPDVLKQRQQLIIQRTR